MDENNNVLELYKIAYDHHKQFMQQRTTCFNFYLIAISIIFGILFESSNLIYQLVLTALSACISFCFCIMDVRTKRLIHSLEILLKQYEKDLVPNNPLMMNYEKPALKDSSKKSKKKRGKKAPKGSPNKISSKHFGLFKNEEIAKGKMKPWISLTYVYRAIYIIVPLFLIITVVLNHCFIK